MSWSKVKDFFFDTPEEHDEQVFEERERIQYMDDDIQLPKTPPKPNVVSFDKAKKAAKVVLLEPRTYAEAQAIADKVREKQAVVMNLQRMPNDQALRMVDFMSGTAYAVGGDIKKIGVRTFLCVPENVDIVGAISELLGEGEENNNKRW